MNVRPGPRGDCDDGSGIIVTVNVTEHGTGLPIPNAIVTVTDDTPGQAAAIRPNTTNDSGHWEELLIPPQAPPGRAYTVQVGAVVVDAETTVQMEPS